MAWLQLHAKKPVGPVRRQAEHLPHLLSETSCKMAWLQLHAKKPVGISESDFSPIKRRCGKFQNHTAAF
ncbi:hypothetical protein OESDEN_02498 [Oesophagostomum dentatum]|uniref:Uncharacterized protein n=1 Tax=Oesophagostomum dentatum TaxID=61180 RepID=A0A0B1TJ00_OESDE|nr:hypothetical protein OESDEN_02498 [Oesophagostomum dentatum]